MSTSTKTKLGIYSIALLMMGAIGISGGLAVIGAHFPNADQTMIQNMVSIPAIVVIPTTLIVGKLAETKSSKAIAIVGALLFLIGGVTPAFLDNLSTILVFRAIFGIGIGIVQVIGTAIVAENFSGDEQNKVQGGLQACQMAGLAIMVYLGGALADISWNLTFYVHLIAIITITTCVTMLKGGAPNRAAASGEKQKTQLTKATLMWAVVIFVLFFSGIIYSISLSFYVQEFNLGTAVDSGLSIAFFAFGGIIMGVLYGKLAAVFKNCTTAVGIFIMALSYIVIICANNIAICHLGSFIFGLGVSTALPGIFINASISVPAYSAAMAISVVTCAQNFSQFLAPFVLNPIAAAIGIKGSANYTIFVIGIIIAVILGVFMLLWGFKKNSEISRA